MAHHQADLEKIGKDGFALVDEFFGKKGGRSRAPQNPTPIIQKNVASKGPRPIHHYIYPPEESHVYRTTRVSATEATFVTEHETTLLHDGAPFMDFSRRRPAWMAL